jgi:epoxyqueuosine reductase
VCPPNRTADRREGVPDVDGEEAWVPLVGLLDATDDELLARHGRWYIPGREARWLRRNALVALGNVGRVDDPEVVAILARYEGADDELLAEHARWAQARLGRRRA